VLLACVGPRASTTPLPGGTTNTTGSHTADYRYMGLPASAHRDCHCQAVHRPWARSSGDVAHAGAAHQRNIADTLVTQRIWEQPAAPRSDPAQAFAVWGYERKLTCSLLVVKSPTDTCLTTDSSGTRRRRLPSPKPRRMPPTPTQILNAMSHMTEPPRTPTHSRTASAGDPPLPLPAGRHGLIPAGGTWVWVSPGTIWIQ
jgi:hypothetical protein